MSRPVIGRYRFHPPACDDYDPRAAAVAQRVIDVITAQLPDVEVEHIGSTAVPGCAGKGIVDLMVLYPDGELETVKDGLSALGFQRQTRGHIHPETRPMRVGSFGCDGERFRLHVHVLETRSPEVADLRTFRDRLRADPDLVTMYVACKRAILAAGTADPALYTARKTAFIRSVVESAASGRPPSTSPLPAPAGDAAARSAT
jgi:GrpB-like predicted nucleotidyltransferase (UPF0157 family)